jgi:NAD(P)-dependent dehydrogenase (short-subunit alcohol dehydrogenase family)
MYNMAGAQVVFVTGAARGIGLAIASRFLSQGALLGVIDQIEGVSDLSATYPTQVKSFIGDVSDSAFMDFAIDSTVAAFGRLDVLVANAGIGGGAPVVNLTDEQFKRILDVNLFGVFASCRAAARHMIPQRSGRIVTVGSIFGQDPPGGTAAYAASKAGVASMTISLARELGAHGITVNCVSPGHITTEMYRSAIERRAKLRGKSVDDVYADELAPIALGEFGTPDDVARVVAFLASEDARYVTGQRINVDGGIQPR